MSVLQRRVLGGAYVVYLLAVAWLVWNPTPSAPGTAVTWLADLTAQSPERAEFALNVVMLVPFSLLGGLLLPRLRVSDWTAAGFFLSGLIEVVQRLVLPTRTGSSRDIVANTLGSLLGALALAVLVALWSRYRREP